MQTVVIVIHLIIVAALIATVLLQRSEGGGLGVGGGGSGFMSSRGTANLLTRTTSYLALGFFVTSLFLSWLAGYDRKPSPLINSNAPISQPGAPAAPLSQGGGVLDSLRQSDQNKAPAGPQAPRSQ